MESEEKFLEDRFARRTPFRVPEGYFDDLASQMMCNLTEQVGRDASAKPLATKIFLRRWLRPVAIAAASVGILFVGTKAYLQLHLPGHERASVRGVSDGSRVTVSPAYAIEDYAMLDAEDVYIYMEESE